MQTEGNLHAVTSVAKGQFRAPQWSQDGTHLSAYGNLSNLNLGHTTVFTGDVFTMLADGSSMKQLTTGQTAAGVAVWSPDGTKLAFAKVVGNTVNAFIMPATGGTATNITPQVLASDQVYPFSWSPDGQSLALTHIGANANDTILVNPASPPSLNDYSVLTPSAYSDYAPVFSPDGQEVACVRSMSTTYIPMGIYASDTTGQNTTELVPYGAAEQGIAWSKFPPPLALVGSSSDSLQSSAAGFLISQDRNTLASLVTFSAGTPSTAVITPQSSGNGSAPLVFTIQANSIGQVSWVNGYFGSKNGFTSPAGVTQLLLSFDSSTGLLNLAVPALSVGTKPAALGSGQGYRGKFAAIYDGTGKNLAPHGASEIKLDPKTGKLLTFR